MNQSIITEDGMTLLVRVMRRADWMLSASGAFTAQKIASEVFLLPSVEQKEEVYLILDWLVEIGDLHLANNVYDVPPCERVYIK